MKSEQFSKVFESEKFGQILVMKDNDDGKPTVDTHICIEGGNMKASMKWSETDEGYEKRENVFDKIDLEFAEKFVETQMWEMAEIMYSEDESSKCETCELEECNGGCDK